MPQMYDPSVDESREGAWPRFYLDSIEDPVASSKEGRAIFREIEMVEINVPKDRTPQVVSPVEDRHRKRWPKTYAAWKEGVKDPIIGTALSQWPLISKSKVEELARQGIRTVEQLVDLPDGAIRAGDGLLALRKKAREYLAASKDNSHLTKLSAELDAEKAKSELLEEQMKEMRIQIAALERMAPKEQKAG